MKRKSLPYYVALGDTRKNDYREARLNRRQYNVLIYLLRGMGVPLKKGTADTETKQAQPTEQERIEAASRGVEISPVK